MVIENDPKIGQAVKIEGEQNPVEATYGGKKITTEDTKTNKISAEYKSTLKLKDEQIKAKGVYLTGKENTELNKQAESAEKTLGKMGHLERKIIQNKNIIESLDKKEYQGGVDIVLKESAQDKRDISRLEKEIIQAQKELKSLEKKFLAQEKRMTSEAEILLRKDLEAALAEEGIEIIKTTSGKLEKTAYIAETVRNSLTDTFITKGTEIHKSKMTDLGGQHKAKLDEIKNKNQQIDNLENEIVDATGVEKVTKQQDLKARQKELLSLEKEAIKLEQQFSKEKSGLEKTVDKFENTLRILEGKNIIESQNLGLFNKMIALFRLYIAGATIENISTVEAPKMSAVAAAEVPGEELPPPAAAAPPPAAGLPDPTGLPAPMIEEEFSPPPPPPAAPPAAPPPPPLAAAPPPAANLPDPTDPPAPMMEEEFSPPPPPPAAPPPAAGLPDPTGLPAPMMEEEFSPPPPPPLTGAAPPEVSGEELPAPPPPAAPPPAPPPPAAPPPAAPPPAAAAPPPPAAEQPVLFRRTVSSQEGQSTDHLAAIRKGRQLKPVSERQVKTSDEQDDSSDNLIKKALLSALMGIRDRVEGSDDEGSDDEGSDDDWLD